MKSCLASLCLLGLLGACLPAALGATKPNIVVILADDLGYGDVSCYNAASKVQTPHIDRLAAQGLRFTDAHSPTAVCTPTRYALLTGRYSWRTRLGRGVLNDYGLPLIDAGRLTLPAFLAQHGYQSACVGKWHLGLDWDLSGYDRNWFAPGYRQAAVPAVTESMLQAWRTVFSRPLTGGPIHRGFHSYFGTDVPNIPPYGFMRDDQLVAIPNVMKQAGDLTDIGNVTTTGAAGPMVEGWRFDQIMPALVDEATRIIEQGAKTRRPFFLYFTLTAPHFPVVPSEKFVGRSGVSALGDFLIETDDAVGRIMAALDRHGLAENTLLVFTSDNGPADNSRIPLRKAGHDGSGGLRGHKGSVYEGGHRVPFVVRWPGHTPAGAMSREPITHACFLATLAELLGGKLPAGAAEDSFSILPVLQGIAPAADKPTHPVIVHDSGASVFALRWQNWKLIARPDGGNELYDLSGDLAEKHNLAAANTAVVARLTGMLRDAITHGRTTPGPTQKNDREVLLRDPKAPLRE